MSGKLMTRCVIQLVSVGFVFIVTGGAAAAASSASTAAGIDGSDIWGIDGSDALGIDGSDIWGIDGSDALGIDGSDIWGIDGSDIWGIDGSDVLGIDGSDIWGIDGSDALGIDGSDIWGIDGSDALGIDGSDIWGIDGSDALGIDGSDALGIDGSDLLVLGAIEHIGDGFISVLGQTVFGNLGGLGTGTTVAVYGSIDTDTGGIVGARVVRVGPRMGGASYLRGMVDKVNLALGIAVVSGMTVDYSALLSNGSAPSVGDIVGVTGRSYGGLNVADPLMDLN